MVSKNVAIAAVTMTATNGPPGGHWAPPSDVGDEWSAWRPLGAAARRGSPPNAVPSRHVWRSRRHHDPGTALDRELAHRCTPERTPSDVSQTPGATPGAPESGPSADSALRECEDVHLDRGRVVVGLRGGDHPIGRDAQRPRGGIGDQRVRPRADDLARVVLEQPVNDVDVGPEQLLVTCDGLGHVVPVVEHELEIETAERAGAARAGPLGARRGQPLPEGRVAGAETVEHLGARGQILDRDGEDRVPLELGKAERGCDRRDHGVEEVRQHGIGRGRLVGVHDQGSVRLGDALEERRVPGDVGEEEGAPPAGPPGAGDEHRGIATRGGLTRRGPGTPGGDQRLVEHERPLASPVSWVSSRGRRADRTGLGAGGIENVTAEVETAGSVAPAWHARSTDDVLREQGVDPEQGLSAADVTARRAKHGPNRFADQQPVPRWRAFLRQYADAMQIVLLIAGILSIYPVKQVSTGVLLILLTVLNAYLGLNQEGKAAAAVAALQKMMVVKARVRRDGEVVELPAEELVPGDIWATASPPSGSWSASRVRRASRCWAGTCWPGSRSRRSSWVGARWLSSRGPRTPTTRPWRGRWA